MKAIGIISEYNPYHTGHAYLLRKAREITGASHAVSVMSGCFSQQGSPMVLDKYLRAAAAASDGLDLVFELPVLYATGSARDFAEGAVLLLTRLGLVDTLCFGVEDPDPDSFERITCCILEEPAAYRDVLLERQKAGDSYPAAREEALASVLGDDVRPVLRQPNNILALEYHLAIRRLGSPLKICMIRRNSDYHSGSTASATAIRNHLTALEASGETGSAGSYLREALPEGAAGLLEPEAAHFLLSSDGLTPYLAARMMELSDLPEESELPLDMTAEVYQRLRKVSLPSDYESIVNDLKRRNETRGRITRSLLHLMLGIREKDRVRPAEIQSPYLNLLAARSESTHLLRKVQDAGELIVITKKSAYIPADPVTDRLWSLDRKAASLYAQLVHDAFGITLPPELKRTPVILD
ncbi:MAG: nucleotidyltransferase family protein [Eubacterium sp.]|nr:nucleotidyltransferase family protein [Eubacterium sp.]